MIETMRSEQDGTLFFLHTKSATLSLLVSAEGFLLLPYWGARIKTSDISYIVKELPFVSYMASTEGRKNFQLGNLPQPYPSFGNSDLRSPAFLFTYEDGSRTTDLSYRGYTIHKGKTKLDGLPFIRPDSSAQTLELQLFDRLKEISVVISMTVYEDYDAITQSVRAENQGKTQTLQIEKLCSASIDLLDSDFEFLHLAGAWDREFQIKRQKLEQGILSIGSAGGASGHEHNPFAALVSPGTDETHGQVYAMNLVYSGNFLASAEVGMHRNTRFQIGLQPFDFSWRLEPGECFQSPEAVLVYSGKGLEGMSNSFHRLYQDCLIPLRFAQKERPILLNSWEAHYYKFCGEDLIRLARQATQVGAELFVLDDGWFGKRMDESSSVGDWIANEEKLGGSLSSLIEKINREGISFGLWAEPEMVSPDSDLYRAHPEWAIQVQGRRMETSREEYVLDLSNPDVCKYIIDSISAILSENPVTYVKWDMNRNFTNLGSTYLPSCRQKEQAHRYMLGLYHVLDVLTNRFPHVLFEGCAGGGGRFDPGMLYYTPQMWVSDDTDAVERLTIQYGASLVYPSIAVECHISETPNHQVGRRESMAARAATAMWGNLGLELNFDRMAGEEINCLMDEIAFYKKVRPVIQFGRLYRLKGLDGGNEYAWMYQSRDREEFLVTFVQVQAKPNTVSKRLRLRGLDPEGWYQIDEGSVRSGRELMCIGLDVGNVREDAFSRRWLLVRIKESISQSF